MLRIFALVGLIFFSQSILAAGQARYISDDVYLFLHGGPGTQYRILGSIEAGQEISNFFKVTNFLKAKLFSLPVKTKIV